MDPSLLAVPMLRSGGSTSMQTMEQGSGLLRDVTDELHGCDEYSQSRDAGPALGRTKYMPTQYASKNNPFVSTSAQPAPRSRRNSTLGTTATASGRRDWVKFDEDDNTTSRPGWVKFDEPKRTSSSATPRNTTGLRDWVTFEDAENAGDGRVNLKATNRTASYSKMTAERAQQEYILGQPRSYSKMTTEELKREFGGEKHRGSTRRASASGHIFRGSSSDDEQPRVYSSYRSQRSPSSRPTHSTWSTSGGSASGRSRRSAGSRKEPSCFGRASNVIWGLSQVAPDYLAGKVRSTLRRGKSSSK